MKVSSREAGLIIATVTVLLFGGTAIMAKSKIDQWKQVIKDKQNVRRAIALDVELVAQRDRWETEYRELSKKLSKFPADQKMDLHWRSVLNRKANSSGIKIIKLDSSNSEEHQGEVFELPIECRDWEGGLESVVSFLYALESGSDMLDIRQIRIRPKKNSRLLSGRFSLYCAYTREGAASESTENNK